MKIAGFIGPRRWGWWPFAIYFAIASAPAEADVLTVTTKGTIAPVCTISVQNDLPPANLTGADRVRGSALVNCNMGFVMRATSMNGALKTEAAAPPGFTNRLPYYLQIALPLQGSTALLARCSSALLLAGNSSCSLSPGGSGLSSGGEPAMDKTAVVTVIWAYSKPRPVAGDYQDTISISVAAAP